jgi:LAS superfamily LD-carboxypeptidase LdcB
MAHRGFEGYLRESGTAFSRMNGRIQSMNAVKTHSTTLLTILLVCSLIGCALLYRALRGSESSGSTREAELRTIIVSAQEAAQAREARIVELETLLTETKTMLEETLEEKEDLRDDLRDEKDRNEEFEDQIEKIGGVVGVLDKLAKTDPELLQKYSKVYFLNEHYMPPKLTEIPDAFVYREGGDPEFLHAEVFPFFEDMVKDALRDGVKLWVVSAFRSFDEQRALKGAYSVTYGSGANTFSADQGYSEHQLGTTMDFTTENLGGGLTNFETTPAYAWLQENAHKYGFVLSYPKDNAYYIFEPWHWRFVGTDLARDLRNDGKSFYDIDQREIDTYLVNLFE